MADYGRRVSSGQTMEDWTIGLLCPSTICSDTLWLDKNGLLRLLGQYDDREMKFSKLLLILRPNDGGLRQTLFQLHQRQSGRHL